VAAFRPETSRVLSPFVVLARENIDGIDDRDNVDTIPESTVQNDSVVETRCLCDTRDVS